MKIVFFGTEDFSGIALSSLINAHYPIAAVVTKADSKKGRGQHLSAPAVKNIALQHNIPVWQPEKLRDIRDNIIKLSDVAGVLVSYGKIIPKNIIDLFTPGIINVHPSLLPKYRGPSPIESAIKNGDKKTGVSIMQLSAKMDAGPVYGMTEVPLSGTETQPQLYQKLATKGSELLLSLLPSILSQTLLPKTQNDAQATYCSLLKKEDAILDIRKLTASEAEQRIRAHLTYPKSKITIKSYSITILKAHTSLIKKTPLDLECRDGIFLCIDELIAPSGKAMKTSDFLRGHLVD